MTIPTLTTERLTLRPPSLADFEPFAAMMATGRAIYMDGPMDRRAACDMFASDVAHWHLRGFGGLTVATTSDGAIVGSVAVSQPPHFPQEELGWMLYDGHEGQGYATEAASALRAHVFATNTLSSLVSYIAPENAASIKVATRLGAVRDDDAPRPLGDDCLVYRHTAADVMQ